MKAGRWYLVIERWQLVIGFGKAPQQYLNLIERDRPHVGVTVPPKDDDDIDHLDFDV